MIEAFRLLDKKARVNEVHKKRTALTSVALVKKSDAFCPKIVVCEPPPPPPPPNTWPPHPDPPGPPSSPRPVMSESFTVVAELSGTMHTFSCRADQTVLAAAELAGVPLPSSCCSGVCTTCAAKLSEGTVDQSEAMGVKPSCRPRVTPSCASPTPAATSNCWPARKMLCMSCSSGSSSDGAAPGGPRPLAPGRMKLQRLDLWLETAPGPLLPSCSQRWGKGDRVRWAITAAEPAADGEPGWRRLRIEAVLLCP